MRNQSKAALPYGLMHAARCSLMTLLLLKMGPDEPSGQHRGGLAHVSHEARR